MCLYGQACYFGQVIHNSYGVSGKERLMCAMPCVFQNIHFSFNQTLEHARVQDGKLKISPNEKLHVKKYFDMAEYLYTILVLYHRIYSFKCTLWKTLKYYLSVHVFLVLNYNFPVVVFTSFGNTIKSLAFCHELSLLYIEMNNIYD